MVKADTRRGPHRWEKKEEGDKNESPCRCTVDTANPPAPPPQQHMKSEAEPMSTCQQPHNALDSSPGEEASHGEGPRTGPAPRRASQNRDPGRAVYPVVKVTGARRARGGGGGRGKGHRAVSNTKGIERKGPASPASPASPRLIWGHAIYPTHR